MCILPCIHQHIHALIKQAHLIANVICQGPLVTRKKHPEEYYWTHQMVHRVKLPTPTVKLDYLSLKPETHTVEEEQHLQQVVL